MCKMVENRQDYVGFDCRIFPLGLNTLDNEEKTKYVFNYTRVTNRAESIVVGSFIISSSFNHEFVVADTKFH